MTETISSLKKLNLYLQQHYNYTLEVLSFLSTLVVENSFSQVRGQVWYPNYYEFVCAMRRAKLEIIKRNSPDYLFPAKKRRLGKKYGNQETVQYSIKDAELTTQTLRKKEHQEIYAKNAGIVTK